MFLVLVDSSISGTNSSRIFNHPNSSTLRTFYITMLAAKIDETPVNTHTTRDGQIAGSMRCSKEDCNNWAEANSRFCTARKSPPL
ncbi:hypothetical protein HZ326_8491 [Fusarium oxysporum f. sp. albedinis]|nr:hypothetical protein HZ326_8491 [Fusarium oxysporum f. sp. albedinis]